MYSDTHFHFEHTTVRDNKDFTIKGSEILAQMAKNKCYFGLDIGTEADDLLKRQACLDTAIANISDSNLADKVRKFIYFSAGIWPSVNDIKKRFRSMEILKQEIQKAENNATDDTLNRKIIAIGECGLDHHWNPSGVDGRNENDFNQVMYLAERELFEMQLEYAKKLNLPVIIHSRDAFEDTLDCIKNIGWDNGIIHCYSYGAEEAKKFLDRGWYISFSGSVTYTKKSKMAAMTELLTCVPDDRILCETDSPYLAPVPLRGSINTPVNVKHTYKFIAGIRQIETEKLCEIVDRNIKSLFKL
ncbi:MAG: TatD family hydrolase [Treponema sp.]|nr:TatD family hydrolase [Treponema sp.]